MNVNLNTLQLSDKLTLNKYFTINKVEAHLHRNVGELVLINAERYGSYYVNKLGIIRGYYLMSGEYGYVITILNNVDDECGNYASNYAFFDSMLSSADFYDSY